MNGVYSREKYCLFVCSLLSWNMLFLCRFLWLSACVLPALWGNCIFFYILGALCFVDEKHFVKFAQ